jgi:SHS2 domain-containing protein
MDKTYEILDHSADLKMRVFGNDLSEVFVNMALAVAKQQAPAQVSAKGAAEEIIIESSDLASLLVDWLSEILYCGEINKKVYTDFEITEFSENPPKIKAKIKGMPVGEKNIDIKAVTYHDLEIKKVNDHWEAVVIFDI